MHFPSFKVNQFFFIRTINKPSARANGLDTEIKNIKATIQADKNELANAKRDYAEAQKKLEKAEIKSRSNSTKEKGQSKSKESKKVMEKKAALQMYSSELEKSKVLFAEQETARWETTFPALISHQASGLKFLKVWTEL